MEMPENQESAASAKRRSSPGKILKIIAWLLPSAIAVGFAVFFYLQWQRAQQAAEQSSAHTTQAEASQEEIQQVVDNLSEIVVLPQGETPTVSTIKDKSSLTENQEFFREAENGDKVLVYQQAKKAFLYRPSTQKLINLAPINISDANTSQAQPTVAAAIDEPLDDAQGKPSPSP